MALNHCDLCSVGSIGTHLIPLEVRGGDAIGTKHVLAAFYFAAWLGSLLTEGLVPYRLDMYLKNDLGYCGKGLSVLSCHVSVL